MGIRVTAPIRIDVSAGWTDSDPHRANFGGSVLNGAINMRVSACFTDHLIVKPEDVPPHTGLGTSGALRAVEIVASNPKLLNDKLDLIRRVHLMENKVVDNRAGFQDEAAAIYGGVKLWEFKENGAIRYWDVKREDADVLEGRLVLVYTGENHLSANIHNLVFGPGNYEPNIPRLERMKNIAMEMFLDIKSDKMADLIRETWELQKALHESIETDTMRGLQKCLKGAYLATRATGAGGGGSMIFYTTDRERFTERFDEIKNDFPGVRIIPFKFEYEGIRLEKITEETGPYMNHRKPEN